MNGTLSEINTRLPVSANTKQLVSLCMLMFPCFSLSLESSKILRGPRLMISYIHLEDSLLLSHLRDVWMSILFSFSPLKIWLTKRYQLPTVLSSQAFTEPMLWRCTHHQNYLIGLDNIHVKENVPIYQLSLSRIRLIFWRVELTVFNK